MDYHLFHGYPQPPFELTPDPGLMVLSKSHEDALDRFYRGIMSGHGFLALTGEVGTGKTMILHTLLGLLSEDFLIAYVYNAHLSSSDLIAVILNEMGVNIDPNASSSERIQTLNAFLIEARESNKRPLIMLDEAQNLSPKTLEEMRVLSNLETPQGKLIQFLLSGQPELIDLLNRPELRQLKQRIGVRAHLTAFSLAETGRYIAERSAMAGCNEQPFKKPHLIHIHALSQGIPRLINTVCDALLLRSFLDDSQIITMEHLKAVKHEYDL